MLESCTVMYWRRGEERCWEGCVRYGSLIRYLGAVVWDGKKWRCGYGDMCLGVGE